MQRKGWLKKNEIEGGRYIVTKGKEGKGVFVKGGEKERRERETDRHTDRGGGGREGGGEGGGENRTILLHHT